MQEFNDANFNSSLLESHELIVVGFWSTDCGPLCNDVLEVLRILETQYLTVTFGTLLTTDNLVTTVRQQIGVVPTVVIYHRGRVLRRFAGAVTAAAVGQGLDDAVDWLNSVVFMESPIVSINLPQASIDRRDLEKLLEAIDEFMEVMGFELEGRGKAIEGSWFQKLRYRLKSPRTREEVFDALEKGKAAFELTYLNQPAADATSAYADAAAKLMAAAERFDEVAIQVGQILLIKVADQGKSILRVITISPQLMMKLNENPQILNDPMATLQLVGELQTRQPRYDIQSAKRDSERKPPSLITQSSVDVCAGLLYRDGEVLLGKRSPDRSSYPNVWDLPGGHCEEGETGEDTLVRELAEEIGIEVLLQQLLTVVDLDNDGMSDVRMHVYHVQQWRGEPKNLLVSEHEEVKWVALPEATFLARPHPAYEAMWSTVISYLAKLNDRDD